MSKLASLLVSGLVFSEMKENLNYILVILTQAAGLIVHELDLSNDDLEHHSLAKLTSVSVADFCYREETTMRSTLTLGPSAMKSPVQRKLGSFVSSFSSHERDRVTVCSCKTETSN